MSAPDPRNANSRSYLSFALAALRRSSGLRWGGVGALVLLLLLPIGASACSLSRPAGAAPMAATPGVVTPANGGSGPNLSLSQTSGGITLSAKLYYHPSASAFGVNASVLFSGGFGPYTLEISWDASSGWSYTNSSVSANTTVALGTSYNRTSLYTFVAAVTYGAGNGTSGNGTQVNGTIRAVVPSSAPGISVRETDQVVSARWTSTFYLGAPYGGTPNYTLLLEFGDGSSYNSSLGLGTTGAVDHTYSGGGLTSYSVNVLLEDARGNWGNSSFLVTPSYVGSNGSGSGSGGPAGACATAQYCAQTSGRNGTFGVQAVLVLNQSMPSGLPLWGQVNVTGMNGSVSYRVDFGDGATGAWSNLSSARTLEFSWVYASAFAGQTLNWSVTAYGSSGAQVFATALLPLGGNQSGNSSGYSSGSYPCGNATCLYIRNTLGPIHYGIDFRLNNSSGPYPVVVNGSFSGGAAPYTMVLQFGDGFSTNNSLYSKPATFRTTHSYASAGTYNWSLWLQDANRTLVNVYLPLTVGGGSPNGSGGGINTSGAYPTPVSVVVAASPVTGSAPLNVTFSAYIDGGAPPFTVLWSLPNGSGNGTGSATGLMASAVYPAAGWFPATAFVYNTTNAYGTVLVGYGSVWVFVTGGSGSGGGNNSSNQSIRPGTIGSTPRAPGSMMGFLAGTTVVALVLALALGGVVGAILGFAFGRGGRPSRAAVRPPAG